jgi:molecular chaperone DnaK (HSP70)
VTLSGSYVVGIDLGTTHSALAHAPRDAEHPQAPSVLPIPQLIQRGSVEAPPLLPSFVYFAHESEGPLALPWAPERRFAVGAYARDRGAEAPSRVIASAKSWLSHAGVDRRANILPPNAPPDVERVSPVEASFRYLDHLAEVWRERGPAAAPLAEQRIVLTVPASFDAAARDLTVEAAYVAGMEDVTLLEEPQAALYAWIDSVGDEWRQLLRPGDVVLVVDLGGGTTDFSLIAVAEREGALELHRVAVGNHILLGGDNMDLALAHVVRQRLLDEGHEVDAWQMNALTHACRGAKERLLAEGAGESLPIVVPSRGSALLGGSLRTELDRADVQRILVDGFFPAVASDAAPAARPRGALRALGLPYAQDPAITKHLAAFLTRQRDALDGLEDMIVPSRAEATLLHPTAVLFNGGVLKAPAVRERLIATLDAWLVADGGAPARILPAEDLDLAVARGAAYFGQLKDGRGLRIRGGTARSYYVGIESPMPAVPGVEPPVLALCVAPFGMEEGNDAPMPDSVVGVVVGEPVRFRFFGSTVRRGDAAGDTLESWSRGELEELAPIEVLLPTEGREVGDVVPARLRASVTPVGTLLIEALPLEPRHDRERWKVELGIRQDA